MDHCCICRNFYGIKTKQQKKNYYCIPLCCSLVIGWYRSPTRQGLPGFVKSLEIWAMNIEHAHRHTQYCHHNHTLWLNTDINAPHYKPTFTMVCHNKHFQDEFWTHLRARNNHLHTDHDRTMHGIPIWHVYLCNIQQQLAERAWYTNLACLLM